MSLPLFFLDWEQRGEAIQSLGRGRAIQSLRTVSLGSSIVGSHILPRCRSINVYRPTVSLSLDKCVSPISLSLNGGFRPNRKGYSIRAD
jgi:hypothetical protein